MLPSITPLPVLIKNLTLPLPTGAATEATLLLIKSQTDKFTFNSDGLLRVQTADSHRLIWDTEIDWNKGIFGVDIEVSGVGPASVIRPALITGSGDVTYNTIGDYTLSSGANLTITGGNAQLKALASSFTWPFTTPGDYTYNSSITVTAGSASLVYTTITPYAWYHLNATSGTVVTDSSGNGRTGATVNGPTWVAGKLNNCLLFNGTNQSANFGNIANFERTQACSYEFWTWTSSNASSMMFMSHWASRGMFLQCGGRQITFNLYGTGGIAVRTTASISASVWHYVVVTYDGSSTAAGVKIYVDNTLQATSTIQDNLTGTTVVSTDFLFAARSDGYYFAGNLDEVIIYDRILTPSEISFGWNSGAGTESRQSYSTINPAITPSAGTSFGLPLTTFTETATKPVGTEIKYQVSADNGVTWKYFTGSAWILSDLSYAQASLASVINGDISTLASSGTFKFRAMLSSQGYDTPLLDQLVTNTSVYSTSDNLYIDTTNASQISSGLASWVLSTFTDTLPTNTDAKVLFSVDGRTSWLTWTGSAWTTSGSPTLRSTATSFANAQTNFSALPGGSGTLDVRLFLYTSDNVVTPQVSNINITYGNDYYTAASYETNIFDSGTLSQLWGAFDVSQVTPAGTTATVKTRVSNFLSNMGSYGSALTVGSNIDLNGQFIQFLVEFTGTITSRAFVDYISARYVTPFIQDVAP